MIFNDLLFESYEAQQEFHELTKGMDQAHVEHLRSVLGKPSQFVGCPKNFHQAVEHWRQWKEFMATDQARFNEQMAEIRQEDRAVQRRRGRPPGPPKPEVRVQRQPLAPGERRGPGRPPIAEGVDKKALKQAMEQWKSKKLELDNFARECNTWLTAQVNTMKAQIQEQIEARQVLVNQAREEYERLRDGSG